MYAKVLNGRYSLARFAGAASLIAGLASVAGPAAAETANSQADATDEQVSSTVPPSSEEQLEERLVRTVHYVDRSMVQVRQPGLQAVTTNLVYLNNCTIPGSCKLQRSGEDSRTNRSSIIGVSQANLSPFPYGATVWDNFVTCVRETLAPFDIEVTENDPGNVPHWENMVAGHPNDVGMGSNIAGVSPWTGGCEVLDNTITFTFAENHPANAQHLCWTAVQEVAHSWGLDHELLQKSPMTYLSGALPKRFQNVEAKCGEDVARRCACGPMTQNSPKYILSIFGPSTPIPPKVTITVPPDGSRVAQGFAVKANYEDDIGVIRAELFVDGQLVQTVNAEPFVFNAPTDLSPGFHTVMVRAYDFQDTAGDSKAVNVEIGPPCTTAKECGEANTCLRGECVPGPSIAGGLGAPCSENEQCFDELCASNGTIGVCSTACSVSANDCPGGFSCANTGSGDAGACWPSDGGGCQGSEPAPWIPVLISTVFILGLARRR